MIVSEDGFPWGGLDSVTFVDLVCHSADSTSPLLTVYISNAGSNCFSSSYIDMAAVICFPTLNMFVKTIQTFSSSFLVKVLHEITTLCIMNNW